jgi:glycerophosphoryl diester phosphodiesterase
MNSSPLILGHRGASAVAPENTLAAFSRAMRDGADGIEFDVRLSRDQVPVVIHDASLKRTGLVNALVSELTAEDLQRIDVGIWFPSGSKRSAQTSPAANENGSSGERLPTLTQVFELFRAYRGLLYIEMKCEPREGAALAAELVRLIREQEMIDRVVVESFALSAVAEVKRIDANIRTAALFEPKLSHPISTFRRERMIDLAKECGADEIALHHTLANPRMVEKAKAQRFEVVVWTVDNAEWIQRARSQGIKALIANNPAQMVHFRNALT